MGMNVKVRHAVRDDCVEFTIERTMHEPFYSHDKTVFSVPLDCLEQVVEELQDAADEAMAEATAEPESEAPGPDVSPPQPSQQTGGDGPPPLDDGTIPAV